MSPGSFGLGFSGALGEITRTTAGVLEAAAKGTCSFSALESLETGLVVVTMG